MFIYISIPFSLFAFLPHPHFSILIFSSASAIRHLQVSDSVFYRHHYEIDKKLKARLCRNTSGVDVCAEIAIRFTKSKKKIYYLGCMVLIAIRDSIFQKTE